METIAKFAEAIGLRSGEPVKNLVALCVIIAAVAFTMAIALYLRDRKFSRADDEEGFDRIGGVLGRLEKLEMNLNQLKTESARAFELFRGDVGFLKQELHDIRAALKIGNQGGGEGSGGAGEEGGGAPPSDGGDLPPFGTPQGASSYSGVAPSPTKSASDALSTRLVKTREGFFSKIKSLFVGKPKIDEEMIEELHAQLISCDLGAKTVTSLIDEVRADIASGRNVDEKSLSSILKMKILSILETGALMDPAIKPARKVDGPTVVMVVGVNGVGKTTTTAKLASKWKEAGANVLMVAADTFRAAAVDQLIEWGEKIGVPVVSGVHEAKPSTVVFDAMSRAQANKVDIVIIDTAGRLHTKSNLMQELEGVRNIVERTQSGAPHETILVLDGSTGSNALAQAKEFHDAVPLTGVIVTKLDGTPKGGIVVAIKNDLGIPVRYIGVGESKNDLRPFVARDFVEALFSTDGLTGGTDQLSAHGETRRRRRREDGDDAATVA